MWRRAVVIGIFVIIAVIVIQLIPQLKRAADRRKIERCMAYTPPAGQVVYEEEPTKAGVLLKQRNYRAAVHFSGPVPAAVYVPTEWEQLKGILPGGFTNSMAALFMHKLKTQTGVEKLVLIELLYWERSGIPTHFWSDAHPRPDVYWGVILPSRPTVDRWDLRFFAGRVDPADASRLLIDYELDGERDSISGQLGDDGSVRNLQLGKLLERKIRSAEAKPATQPSGGFTPTAR
jgi:hypothetical protein